MSSTDPPSQPLAEPKQPTDSSEAAPSTSQPEATMDTTPDQPVEETWDDIPDDVLNSTTDDILTRVRLIDNEIKVSSLLTLVFQYSCLSH